MFILIIPFFILVIFLLSKYIPNKFYYRNYIKCNRFKFLFIFIRLFIHKMKKFQNFVFIIFFIIAICYFTFLFYETNQVLYFKQKVISRNFLNLKFYDYSIFFLESNYMRSEITTKQMCSIESAAKTNPNALIQVYSFSAKLNEKAKYLLKKYRNLKIIKFNPEQVFSDTPILKWWQSGAVLKSPYSFSHLTDAFR